MCGIGGFFSTENFSLPSSTLKQMSELLRHRGPNAEGFYTDAHCSLVHRRLKILDLSDEANQPMISEDRSQSLVFNGEIYNYKELRKSLEEKQIIFKTQSDTEVLFRGLCEYGEAFITKLEGDFAFAFRDKTKNLFLLARDRFGVKPLYTSKKDGVLYFASEVKALFAAGIEKSINNSMISEYFRFRYVAGIETLFKNIFHFPAGHYLKIEGNQSSLGCYYKVGSKEQLSRNFSDVFSESVGARLHADVKVGAFLSSGLDSSSIVAEAKSLKHSLSTFSYSFGDKLDESNEAADFSRSLGFSNFKIHDLEKSYLNYAQVINQLEEPIGDAIILANSHLFSEAKKEVTVALSGEGADEIFSTYAHHKAFGIIKELRKNALIAKLAQWGIRIMPLEILNRISFYPVRLNTELKSRILSALSAKDDASVWLNLASLFNEAELKALLKQNYNDPRIFFEQNILLTDIKNWLPRYGLLRTDKLSMAHSLEVRVPFLSHKVVDLVLNENSMTSIQWLRRDKRLLRQHAAERLKLSGKNVLKKKQPFFSPESLFRSDHYRRFLRETLSRERMEKYGILDTKYVDGLVEQSQSDFLLSKKITAILIFQIWCETYFPDGFI